MVDRLVVFKGRKPFKQVMFIRGLFSSYCGGFQPSGLSVGPFMPILDQFLRKILGTAYFY